MRAIKYIFVLAFVFVTGQIYAQDVYVSKNGANAEVSLDAGDTLSNNSTTLSKVFYLGNKDAVQLYSIQVSADSISGTPAVAWVLGGSLDNSNYTTITTVNWAGSADDTTFVYTDISTGVAWPYLRVRGTITGTAKAQLTKLVGRFLDEVK